MSPLVALVVWFAAAGYAIGKRYKKPGTGILIGIPVAVVSYVGVHALI